nr:S-methyl-5-thioribose kinase [Bacillus alkalicellulosilyticus]
MTKEYPNYAPFTEQTVIEYLKEIGLFAKEEPVSSEEIGDGNLNLVFRVKNEKTDKSYIAKQALPYAKVVGTSWPLTLDRARIEYEALKKENTLLPELTPTVHYANEELALTVMDDLSHLVIMRKGLIQGEVYPKVAKDIGTFLAHTLFYSSDFGMDQQDKKLMASSFTNPELCKITEDLVFTDPFFDHDTNSFPEELRPYIEDTIWSASDLKEEVALLKFNFLTKGEALIHGDLHTGSIFVSPNETKVIDPEFAFVGPFGFDIGAFIANLILNYLSQEGHQPDEKQREQYQNYLLSCIQEVWEVFEETFTSLWETNQNDVYMTVPAFRKKLLESIFQDAIGFAGCKVIRRTIGLAHVEDIESIQDANVKLTVQKKALALGKELILTRHQFQTIDDIVKVVSQS